MDLPDRPVVALASVAATATGVMLVIEAFRAFGPSVQFIYADAGSTPAGQMGAFALIPFVVAASAAPLARWAGPRRTTLVLAALLVIARLLLQATSGGRPQLVASTTMVVGAFGWLVAVAAGGLPRRAVAVGSVAGLGFDVALHGALRTVGLVWRDGTVGWFGSCVLLALFALATWTARRIEPAPGPAWPWVAVGPVLALHGIVGVQGRIAVAADLTPVAALVVLGAAHALAVASILVLRREPSRLGGVVAAGLVVLGLYATTAAPMPFDVPAVTAGGQVLLTVGLALTVATVGWTTGRRGPLGRGLAAAGGLLVMFVVVFGYYAGYDIRLPVDNDLFLWVGAATVSFVLVTTLPAGPVPGGGRFGPALTGTVVVAVLVAVAAVATQQRRLEPEADPGFPLRAMTYNLRMGFDTVGALSVDRLADVIRQQDPDIVALNEVDRAWLTTGSVDVLTVLAEEVGLPYLFAPAADAVWGNALLSRYPVRDVQIDPLPRGGAAMRRSALSAVIDVRHRNVGGIGVVVTHLHHVDDEPSIRADQAARVARIAAELRTSGFPVVVMGDMNAAPDAPELEPLSELLANATVGPQPPPDERRGGTLGVPTYPSTDPVDPIDHIYISEPFAATDLTVPASTASDHLGVAVTLRIQG